MNDEYVWDEINWGHKLGIVCEQYNNVKYYVYGST